MRKFLIKSTRPGGGNSILICDKTGYYWDSSGWEKSTTMLTHVIMDVKAGGALELGMNTYIKQINNATHKVVDKITKE